MIRFQYRMAALYATFFAMVLALFSSVSGGDEPVRANKPAAVAEPAPVRPAASSAPESPRKNFKLPGLVVNFQMRCVDLEGSICLAEGFLELIACTEGTKEHESIVVVKARPMHIHTALLLVGANNGNPAMRKAVGEDQTRWINIPPRGDPVEVFLVTENQDGEKAERPIGDFIARAAEGPDERFDPDADSLEENGTDEDTAFPGTFLFAGSQLVSDGPGPRKYLSDLSGNVISIVTFGDEVLCLPSVHGHANDSLMWQVDATHLPKIGTKVTLRLRPQVKKAGNGDGDADQPTNVEHSFNGKP